MKTTKAFRQQILFALIDARTVAQAKHCPNCNENRPDEWTKENVRQWDIIDTTLNAVEQELVKIVGPLLPSRKPIP